MKSSLSQLKAARKDVNTMIQQEQEYREGIRIAIARSRLLEKRSLHIEQMFIFAQVVEHLIKYVLMGFKTKKRVETRFGLEKEAYDLSDLDPKFALNQLIGLLEKELDKKVAANVRLIKDLKDFNTEYRNKLVHKLFDGKEKDLKSVNKQMDIYLKKHSGGLVTRLHSLDDKIVKDVEQLIEDNGEE